MKGRGPFLGLWSVVLQWSRFGIAAIVFLVIARWLSLAEIGSFAVAAAPLRLLLVIHRNGITDAVIVKRAGANKARDTDALFALSLIAALVSSVTLLLGAYLASGLSALSDDIFAMMAYLALVPLLTGIAAVPEGILRHGLRIRALALRTLAVQSCAAAAAIIAASQGLGAWSMVIFLLVNAGLGAISTSVLARWCPGRLPDGAEIRRSLSLVLLLSGQGLTATALQPILQFGVGVWLGMADAGAFQIALRFLGLLDAIAVAPLRFLALPLLTAVATSLGNPVSLMLRGLRLATLVIAPVYLGAAAVAPTILMLFVGSDHAASSVLLLQIFCIFGFANAACMVLMQASVATGQARLALWRSLAMLVSSVALAWPALGMSVVAVASATTLAALCVSVAIFFIVPARLGLSPAQCFAAVAPPILSGLLMAIVLFTARSLDVLQSTSSVISLSVSAIAGIVMYALLMQVFDRAALADVRRALAASERSA